MGRIGFPQQFIPLSKDGKITDEWHRYFQDLHKFSGLDAEKFPLYQDCSISPLAMSVGPSDPATLVALSGGVLTYSFDPDALNQLYFSVQLPHGYLPDTKVLPFIQWCPSLSGVGNVVWGIEYTWAGIGFTVPAAATLTKTAASPETAMKHAYTELDEINPRVPSSNTKDKTISSCFFARIYRDGANSADNYKDPVFLLSAGIHYQNAAHGTVQPWP